MQSYSSKYDNEILKQTKNILDLFKNNIILLLLWAKTGIRQFSIIIYLEFKSFVDLASWLIKMSQITYNKYTHQSNIH